MKLNADVLASRRRRGAGGHELARTAFNDYGPLLGLGRLDDADSLLQGCQSVFEQTGDTVLLGRTLSARANLADERDHLASAVNLERAALRHKYLQPDPDSIAVSHHNLAKYLARAQAAPDVWLGHRLAAALLYGLTGMTGQRGTLRALARVMRNPAVAAALPATVQQLREQVDLTPGVRFGALLDAVQPDPGAQQTALDGVLHAARTMPDEQLYDPQRAVEKWEPLLAGIVVATDGDPAVAEDVQRALDRLIDSPDWGALVVVLRQVLAGEREPQSLLSGLNPVDTAIVTRLLDALAGRTELHPGSPASSADGGTGQELPEQWQQTMAMVIAAVQGDQSAVQALQPLLEQLTDDPDWAALATALRAVLAGDRDPDRLLVGLDEFDTTVVQTILAVLTHQADDQS